MKKNIPRYAMGQRIAKTVTHKSVADGTDQTFNNEDEYKNAMNAANSNDKNGNK